MSLTPSRHRRKPLAGPKGSGAPGIEDAAVERRKADRLRKAGACLARARGGYICAVTALRSLLEGSQPKTKQKLGRDFPAARRMAHGRGEYDENARERRAQGRPTGSAR